MELTIQERSNLSGWITFHAVAIWSAASYWLRFRRVCAWHEPKPKRMGGNPLARRVTHGICPECFARVSAEIISHGETDLRVSVTKAGQHGRGVSSRAPGAQLRRSGMAAMALCWRHGHAPPRSSPWEISRLSTLNRSTRRLNSSTSTI